MKIIFSKLFIAGLMLASSLAFSADVSVPNTFVNGAVADADEVNANFTALVDGVNAKQGTHKGAIYRWASFHTYSQAQGWIMGNNANMFGGVAPSVWTDGNGSAGQMSADKEVLRTLFTRKGYGGKNAVVLSDNWYSYSSTNGQMVLALFRVKNTTQADISWTPSFYYTSYGSWGEIASVALNGVNIWTNGSNCYPCGPQSVALSIPADRTSTVIAVAGSSPPNNTRATVLAFTNDSLDLPAGLEFIDDLDTATGGWDQ